MCRLGPGPRRGGTKSSLLHASTRLGAQISTIQVARDFTGNYVHSCNFSSIRPSKHARMHTCTHARMHACTHAKSRKRSASYGALRYLFKFAAYVKSTYLLATGVRHLQLSSKQYQGISGHAPGEIRSHTRRYQDTHQGRSGHAPGGVEVTHQEIPGKFRLRTRRYQDMSGHAPGNIRSRIQSAINTSTHTEATHTHTFTSTHI